LVFDGEVGGEGGGVEIGGKDQADVEVVVEAGGVGQSSRVAPVPAAKDADAPRERRMLAAEEMVSRAL
jgi:hypothetical protein